ncbi:MAG TPA: esterase-like activity of phytase family protein [Microlunatus sp.]
MPARPFSRLSTLVATAALVASLLVTTAPATGAAGGSDRVGSGRSFERLATFPVYLNSPDPGVETVAEITAASADGRTLISTDSPGERVTFTDISNPRRPRPAGALAVGGEPTSVAVYRSYALISVNTSPSFTDPRGQLLVVSLADRSVRARIELGGQPDSIAISPSGARGGPFAAIAIENERDEDLNDGQIPQLPGGFVVALSLTGAPRTWEPRRIDLVPALAGVSGLVAPEDPEPEYVTINRRNELAVTLQENNGIAVIDLRSRSVRRVFTAGAVDLNGIDTEEDDTIDPTGALADVSREPDGIAWVGDGLLATANEGDLVGGSRGWSVFDASNGAVIWDAGNTVERLAISVGLYPESRSENKGTEPENITVGRIDGRDYAFVGAERGNFVAVYDLANPRAPRFQQVLPVTNGPEGLLVLPKRKLLVASSEIDLPEDNVRATISIFGLGRGAPEFPALRSGSTAGVPIGWGALSGLTADPRRADRLWSVSDSYYNPTKLYAIAIATATGDRPGQGHGQRGPTGLITAALTVTENGSPIGVDGEGLAARRAGGFWLAAEGASGPTNQILLLNADAAVQRRIALPAEISAGLGSRGLEGIAVTGSGPSEELFVALQGPLSSDPAGVTRIGRYQVATGTWTWFGYRLDAGSNVGLSELVALGGNRFAVLERDNLAGPTAAVKRIYTVDLDDASGSAGLSVLSKRLVRDLLPDLRATNGWVQEKVEGLTVGGNGRVYLVTDNDGVEDATGETVFADLGSARRIF